MKHIYVQMIQIKKKKLMVENDISDPSDMRLDVQKYIICYQCVIPNSTWLDTCGQTRFQWPSIVQSSLFNRILIIIQIMIQK